MTNWKSGIVLIFLTSLLAMSCSSGGNNPIVPDNDNQLTIGQSNTQGSQTHLWGLYDVHLDLETNEAFVELNRNVMFTANVVDFLNSSPATLQFDINATQIETDYVDIDIDIQLTHPLPGMPEYNGYDVRGVFIGDWSKVSAYNNSLRYAVAGTDQYVFNADGYTRWYNGYEFGTPGVLGYTKGLIATAGYSAGSTLNPYMYFADGLGLKGGLFEFLTTTPDNGVFSSGSTNKRNYYIRFPFTKNVIFNYAVIANWVGVEPENHPANAPEAVACSTTIADGVYFNSEFDNGGNLALDFDLFGWHEQPSKMFIESSVLSAPHEFTELEMTPVDGNETYSTYHVEIPADDVTSPNGNNLFIIAETETTYENEFGVSNDAGTDPLAAFFRFDIPVGGLAVENHPPSVSFGVFGNSIPDPADNETYIVIASDPDPADILFYDWTVKDDTETIVHSSIGGLAGTFDINWDTDIGAVNGEVYTIDCSVTDTELVANATTLAVVIGGTASGNNPPVIISGVTGNSNPSSSSVETYNVAAYDPDTGDTLVYSWVVTDDSVPPVEVLTDPADLTGSLNVDWGNLGASLGDVFSIDCQVHDGTIGIVASTLGITIGGTPPQNFPPYIISGVLGDTIPEPTDVSDYTVTAYDPNPGDTLTYNWYVKDSLDATVHSVIGNTTGILSVDWTNDVGASDTEEYVVECDVTDSFIPTPATPLDITITVCPSEIYSTSFEASDPDMSNWSHVSGFWECGWFSGEINSRDSSCDSYSANYLSSWAGRTIGFTVPPCWDPADTIEGHILSDLEQTWLVQWDYVAVSYTSNATPYIDSNNSWYIDTGTNSWTDEIDTIDLSAVGVGPGDTVYIWFWHGSTNSIWNNLYDGWTIKEFTID